MAPFTLRRAAPPIHVCRGQLGLGIEERPFVLSEPVLDLVESSDFLFLGTTFKALFDFKHEAPDTHPLLRMAQPG